MKLKRWLTILLFTILSLSTFAQGSTAVYPVEVSTFITPPYGTCLKDFVGSQRFQVHVLLRDLTKKNDDFVIIMSVKDMGGKTIFRSNVGQFTFANRGTMIVPAEVNTHILQNLFQPANIEIGEKYATNCFPEGAYTISFQAFDAKFYNIAKRRIPLSRESVTQLFMQSSTDKVYLVYPYKDETICSTINGSVINYQWQPANPTGEIISYHLEVVKLESEFEKQSPKSAFARTTRVLDVDNLYRSIYTDHILTTNYTEGNFYAWRVTVKKGYEQTASTAETNQEIRVFEYRCNALEPVVDTYDPLIIAEKQLDKKLDKITLEEVSNTGADALLKWREDPAEIRKKYCGVGIEIRKFGGEKWTAFKNTTTEEFEYSLSQLSRNVSYEARAHYIQCPDETHEDSIYGPYSDIIEFSIPKENDESECGSPIPDLSDCTDKKAKILRAGDTIIANGTKVFVDKITEYSADSTEITGEGHVCFPIITNIQLRMKFDKIKINCAGELANGEIHAVYDVSTCAMIDLEELTGEGFTGGTEKSASESQINDMKDFDKGSAGDYFKDEKGTVYMKDENGEKVEIGKILTLDNTQFSFDHDRLASQDHFVIFSNPTPETIAFDNDKDGFYRAIRGSNYSSYSDKYIIPYLANIPGLIKTLNAEEVRVNDRVDLFEDVKFVIESSDGSYLELTKTVLDEKTNKFEIKVPGTSDYEHLTYVRVIGKPKDSEQYQIAGKLIVCNFKKQTHNLVIVPTLSSYSVDESKIANELNRIYGRIGISFNVTVDKSFVDKQEVLELLENGLDISTDDQEKHSWDVESPDMKKIRRLYQESHSDISTKKAAYLFLVNRPEDKYSSVDGDMPRNQSVGYIFMKDKNELTDVRLIAHELGHGVFRLQHTFAYKGMDETKKKTDNLMDYNPSNPDFLAYYQWNVLQDSAFFVWKALQDDEDAMGIKGDIFKCVGKSVVKTLASNVKDEFFDSMIELFFTGDTKRNQSKSFNFSSEDIISGVPGFLDDVANDLIDKDNSCISDLFPDEKDKSTLKKVKKYAEAVAKALDVISLISDIFDCYANSESEPQLNICLCQAFVGYGTDEIVGIFSGILDGLDENKAKDQKTLKRIKKLKDKISDYLEKNKIQGQIVKMTGEQLKQAIFDEICGEKKKSEDMSKSAKDFFEIEKNEYTDEFVIKVLTAKEGLTGVVCTFFDKEGNSTPSQNLWNQRFKCSSTLWADGKDDKVNQEEYYALGNKKNITNAKELEDNKIAYFPDACGKSNAFSPQLVTCIVHTFPSYLCGENFPTGERSYYDNSRPKCIGSTGKIYCEYKLKVPCPEDGGRFKIDFFGKILSKDDDEISITKTKSVSCAPKPDVTPVSDNPKPVIYPLYFDDECSDDYKNIDKYEQSYIKNPFGRVKQTSATTYENQSPREVHEGPLGIPKCSGWTLKEEHDGVRVYSVSPRTKCSGKFIPNLYTVTIYQGTKEPEVVQNALPFGEINKYKYDILEFWDGTSQIVVPHYCCVNCCRLVDLDEFINNVTKDNVFVYAFITMLIDWEYNFSKYREQLPNSLSFVYDKSDSFVYYFIRNSGIKYESSKVTHIGSPAYITQSDVKKIIEDYIPASVLLGVNSAVKITPEAMKKLILSKCPVKCVFSDMIAKIAREFSKYKNKLVEEDEFGSARADVNSYLIAKNELENYFSILAWEIFRKNGFNISGKSTGDMGTWVKDGIQPLFYEVSASGNPTFYKALFDFTNNNKCK